MLPPTPATHSLGRPPTYHRGRQAGTVAGTKLYPFDAYSLVKLARASHVKVASRVVYDGAAMLVVSVTGLVHIRGRNGLRYPLVERR